MRTIIQCGCGEKENVGRQGLLDTPKRVARAWMAMAAADKVAEHSQTLKSNATDIIKNALFYEEILTTSPHCGFVLVKDMTFASLHRDTLLPMYGTCHVAYIPKQGTIVGLSKLSRVVSNLSVRGLQRGGDLCQSVLDVVNDTVENNGGVAVVLDVWEYTYDDGGERGDHHHQKRRLYYKRTGAFCDHDGDGLYSAMDELNVMLGLPCSVGKVSMTDNDVSMESRVVNHEKMAGRIEAIASAVSVLLESIGEDPTSVQSKRSASHYASWFLDSTRGYSMDDSIDVVFKEKRMEKISVLGSTETSSATSAEDEKLLHIKTFAFTSQCEHHLLPFSGHFAVYINILSHIDRPTLDVLDSVYAHHVDRFSKRLQVQERLTQQIGDAFWDSIVKLGIDSKIGDIVVLCECKHMCMIARGVQQHCSSTSSYTVRSQPQRDDGSSLLLDGHARVRALTLLRNEMSNVHSQK